MKNRAHTWGPLAIVVSIVLPILDGVLGFGATGRDLIRSFALITAVFVVVPTLVITRRYARNWQVDPTKARLLPRHVVFMSIGVNVIVISASVRVVDLLGQPFAWYGTPVIWPGLMFIAVGLWDMVSWLPDRTAPPDNSRRRIADYGHNETA